LEGRREQKPETPIRREKKKIGNEKAQADGINPRSLSSRLTCGSKGNYYGRVGGKGRWRGGRDPKKSNRKSKNFARDLHDLIARLDTRRKVTKTSGKKLNSKKRKSDWSLSKKKKERKGRKKKKPDRKRGGRRPEGTGGGKTKIRETGAMQSRAASRGMKETPVATKKGRQK